MHIFECNSKNILSIFMKFSGYMDIVISYNQICIVAINIHHCGFYGNIFVTVYQTFYIFDHHSKNIWSIFMKFSEHMGLVFFYNQTYIVAIDIQQCGFHDNIFIIFHQTFLHFWSLFEEYLINLNEIFRTHGYGHLLQSDIYCCYGYLLMLFPWQHTVIFDRIL